jgi:hypothetical protein
MNGRQRRRFQVSLAWLVVLVNSCTTGFNDPGHKDWRS